MMSFLLNEELSISWNGKRFTARWRPRRQIHLAIRGFEVSPEWYAAMTSNPEVRAAVTEMTGLRFV